ncbi:MAG: hypothetical protein CV045_07395 [Cyanobacteria bacterium M5B4]|nr:MAG: hypothetical protein CV045_07395 [Cyanobacteria bacterium M5B4]
MIPKYTTQGAVQKALLNRIIIVDDMTSSVKGQTRQIIGIDLFLEFAEEVELGFIDVFLGMLYVMPLKNLILT